VALAGRLFFLGGIHGVGKGTFCKRLSTKAGLVCVTASNLIRNFRPSDNGKKRVKDIDANQSALQQALNDYRASETRDIVLDGHYVLFDANGQVQDIADNIFKTLNPVRLLLMTSETSLTRTRLLERDGYAPEIGELEKMAMRETSRAENLAEKLQIPLKVFFADESIDEVLAFLE
jgi:adenylate kinase